MTNRVPITTTPGLIAPLAGVDLVVANLEAPATAVRVFLQRTDASPGDVDVVELRSEAGGAGGAITVTIPDGDQSAVATGNLALGAGPVFLRVVSGGATSMNLSGYFELDPAVGVTTALTTLARVKEDEGITDTAKDAQLQRLIDGVSAAIQSETGTIVARSVVEKRDAAGFHAELYPFNRVADPSGVAVRLRGSDLTPGTDFEVDPESDAVVRLSGDAPIAWPKGTRIVELSYTAGFLTVPEDLAMAATEEVRRHFKQTHPSGTDRLGISSSQPNTGGTTSYADLDWSPSTARIVARYAQDARW